MLGQIQEQFSMFFELLMKEVKLNPVQDCKFYDFICRVCIKMSGFHYQRLILIYTKIIFIESRIKAHILLCTLYIRLLFLLLIDLCQMSV